MVFTIHFSKSEFKKKRSIECDLHYYVCKNDIASVLSCQPVKKFVSPCVLPLPKCIIMMQQCSRNIVHMNNLAAASDFNLFGHHFYPSMYETVGWSDLSSVTSAFRAATRLINVLLPANFSYADVYLAQVATCLGIDQNNRSKHTMKCHLTLYIYALDMKKCTPQRGYQDMSVNFVDKVTLTNHVVHSESFHWAQLFLVAFFWL